MNIKKQIAHTFLVAHGNVGVEQGGEGALFGQLCFGCQGIIPQSLDQHGRQIQRLHTEKQFNNHIQDS